MWADSVLPTCIIIMMDHVIKIAMGVLFLLSLNCAVVSYYNNKKSPIMLASTIIIANYNYNLTFGLNDTLK